MSLLNNISSLALSKQVKKGESVQDVQELIQHYKARYPKHVFYEGLKRGIDIFSASLLLTALSPLMFVLIIAVRISSKGSAIFHQQRLTKDGRIFNMYKFRTMIFNAESSSGPVYSRGSEDPRITKFGRFLRITRLDELPQLINVLIGDMSLIGPRPERPEMAQELAKKLPSFHRRLEVKAGLTGLAQTEGGYADDVDSYRRKLAWDLLYIKNRGILLDIKIAIKTVLVIITGYGAR